MFWSNLAVQLQVEEATRLRFIHNLDRWTSGETLFAPEAINSWAKVKSRKLTAQGKVLGSHRAVPGAPAWE